MRMFKLRLGDYFCRNFEEVAKEEIEKMVKTFSSQSLKRGAATHASNLGVSEGEIRKKFV